MLPNAAPEPYSIGEHIVAASSKLVVIDKLLADILPRGERVLIFSVRSLSSAYLTVYSVQLLAMDNVSEPRVPSK